jgi:hypothetical protein
MEEVISTAAEAYFRLSFFMQAVKVNMTDLSEREENKDQDGTHVEKKLV